MNHQVVLRATLGIIGVGLLLATFAIFLPVSMMAMTHRWLGLGEFPDASITIYLARSTSLLYAIHGFVLTYVAWHFDRYGSMAEVLGWIHVVCGAFMFGIDWNANMPLYWWIGEGPGVAAMGIVVVYLARRCQEDGN